MAKSKKKQQKNGGLVDDTKHIKANVKMIISDNRTYRIIGAVVIVISLLLLMSFISHAFTWKEDQDKIAKKASAFLVENAVSKNWLGRLGTYASNFFIAEGFGISAYLIPCFAMAVGLNLFSNNRIFNIARFAKFLFIALPLLSLLFSFIFFNRTSYAFGGYVGDYLYDTATAFMGRTGLLLLFILLGLSYAIWKYNYVFSLPKFITNKKDADLANHTNEDLNALKDNNSELEDAALLIVNKTEADTSEGVLKNAKKTKETFVTPIWENPALTNEQGKESNEIELSMKAEDIPSSVHVVLPQHHTPKKNSKEQSINTSSKEDAKVLSHLPLMEVDENEIGKTLLNTTPNNILATNTESTSNIEFTINTDPIVPKEEMLEVNPSKVDKPEPYDPLLNLKGYTFPSVELLENHGSEKIIQDPAELENYKNQIISTLKNYDIQIQRIAATVGPTVTLYEIVPAPGVRISRIKNLEDDIALSLSALGIRIIAPIPGRGTIGIEVPNVKKTVVSMKTLLSSDKFNNNNYSLPIAIGKRIDNENFIVDLATMPHLLMAGATGQGKSVGLNAILVSLLYKKHPSQLKFVLVDPKKVELSIYKVIENHFLAKLPNEEDAIITDTKKVVYTLNALCIEMDNRYDLLKEASCRNIKEYNEKFVARRLNPEKGHQYLPFIVLVVDEFADLIMTAGKEVEMPIARLAQLARAVGIHLIIATQRPSVNIITGTIKANFPARIAFKVSSKIDSRTILDTGGAEQLIGKGDMLISFNGELTRLQCAFVDTPEVEKVSNFIGYQEGYPQPFLLPEYIDEKDAEARDFDISDKDALFEDAARLIVQNQLGSTSLIQRRMKLGYNRAGRIMEQLESAGIVGPSQGSKPREVYVKTEIDLLELLTNL
jgi:DNA segregation ATPase FtsK/SpoIIIE, S-DNA-T family